MKWCWSFWRSSDLFSNLEEDFSVSQKILKLHQGYFLHFSSFFINSVKKVSHNSSCNAWKELFLISPAFLDGLELSVWQPPYFQTSICSAAVEVLLWHIKLTDSRRCLVEQRTLTVFSWICVHQTMSRQTPHLKQTIWTMSRQTLHLKTDNMNYELTDPTPENSSTRI